MGTRIRDWQASGALQAGGATDWVAERAFPQGDIPAVRRFTEAFGARAGLASESLADFTLAVSEAATCATAVGPCTARVRLWVTGALAFCEVRGNGMLRRAAGGTGSVGRSVEEDALRRYVLNRLSDHVSVVFDQDGVWVLLSMRLA